MSGSMPPHYVSVEEEYKRNPQLKMSDLQMLEDWMDKQPHLPKTEIFYLIMFLHRNNYQIEPTKRMIENYFTLRTHAPEMFSNRNIETWEPLEKTLTHTGYGLLEQESEDNCLIIYGGVLHSDMSTFFFSEQVKYLLMVCDTHNMIRGTNNGYILILNTTEFTFAHAARIDIVTCQKLLVYLHKVAPMRLKAIHMLYVNPAAQTVLNLLKSLMSAELWSLLHIHTSLETLKEFIPVEALPNDAGGRGGSFKEMMTKTTALLSEFREWFEYDERNRKVNESLRIGECETGENLFGAEGSFRKLDID